MTARSMAGVAGAASTLHDAAEQCARNGHDPPLFIAQQQGAVRTSDATPVVTSTKWRRTIHAMGRRTGEILYVAGAAECTVLHSPAMDPKQIVHSDPEIVSGAPVFVGTRVPAQALLDYLEGGETIEEFLDDFPSVTREQAVAFLEEAGRALFARIA